MSDIFLSYSSKDRDWASRFAAQVAENGWSVWWDRTIPAGKTYHGVIGDALECARCVVVVWSAESVKSPWVLEEAEEGRDRGILVPVLSERVRPPLGFRTIQAIDLTEWSPNQLQRLARDIERVAGPPVAGKLHDATALPPQPAADRPDAPAAPVQKTGPEKAFRADHSKRAGSPGEVAAAAEGANSTPSRRSRVPIDRRATLHAAISLAAAVGASAIKTQINQAFWTESGEMPSSLFLAHAVVSVLALWCLREFAPWSPRIKVAAFAAVLIALDAILYPTLGIGVRSFVAFLIDWTITSVVVLIAMIHGTYEAKRRRAALFAWGSAAGFAAGVAGATVLGIIYGFHFTPRLWLYVCSDGVILGLLIAFVEAMSRPLPVDARPVGSAQSS